MIPNLALELKNDYFDDQTCTGMFLFFLSKTERSIREIM